MNQANQNPENHFELTLSLQERLEGLEAAVVEIHPRIAAQQAALYALIATHPDPKSLFDQFASMIDLSAPDLGEQPIPQLREEMQRLQEKIRQAASRRPT